RRRAAAAGGPAGEGLARLALGRELADDAHRRRAGVLGGKPQRLLAEGDLHAADVAAEQELVAGRRTTVGPAFDTHEADVGDVVLAARVGATGDVHAHATDVGQAGVLEGDADVRRQTARRGGGQVAGVGARAGHDIAGQLGA